jgi:chromosome segregation ATPase
MFSQVDERKPQIDEAKTHIDVVKPQIDEVKPQIDEVKPQIDEVKPQIDEVKPQIDEVKLQIDDEFDVDYDEDVDNGVTSIQARIVTTDLTVMKFDDIDDVMSEVIKGSSKGLGLGQSANF